MVEGNLIPRALKRVFIEYFFTQKGYKCYHPPSHKFFVFKDVAFHEKESYFVESHLQEVNVNKENETLLFPDLTLGPEVEVETSSNNGIELDSKKDENV